MHSPVTNYHLATTHHKDRFIASCTSWDDFCARTNKLSSGGEKGAVFERLTQLYLQMTPEYRTELRDVWLLREVPADIRRRLNLPGPDEGIDLIARHTARGILGHPDKIPQSARQAAQSSRIRHLYELGVQYMQRHRIGCCCAHLHQAGQQASLDA
jgi:Mrr restriction endonuclease-like protein